MSSIDHQTVRYERFRSRAETPMVWLSVAFIALFAAEYVLEPGGSTAQVLGALDVVIWAAFGLE